MTLTIFCPNRHLLLDLARCATCGWVRPSATPAGLPAWAALDLRETLAGSMYTQALPAAAQGVLVMALNNRSLVGVDLASGQERWRSQPGAGLVTRQLLATQGGKRLLAGLSDERELGQTGSAQLVEIDPLSGQIKSLWEPGGHLLSLPARSEDCLLVRSSNLGLVALSNAAQPQVLWKAALRTWWHLPPFAYQGYVLVCDGQAMQAEGWLHAFEVKSGRQVWKERTDGLLSQPLSAWEDLLMYQNGRKQIVAREVVNGAQCWQISEGKLYTAPVCADGLVFYVARGSAPLGALGHYVLKAAEAGSGKPSWQVSLPGRVHSRPLFADGILYLVDDAGRLLAFRPGQDRSLFELQLGSEQDPPRSDLILAGGLLLLGLYSGKLHAISTGKTAEKLETPEAHLARGERDLAAAAYALGGNYVQAAGVYVSAPAELDKALALYEKGQLFALAGALASEHGLFAEAERYYAQAGDLPSQAGMLLRHGQTLLAARLLEQAGELVQAAELYEQAAAYTQAIVLYKHLGDRTSLERALRAAGDADGLVQFLLEDGRPLEAAETAQLSSQALQAADLFKQANQPQRELDALLQIKESAASQSILRRIAHLACQQGRFADEARAWKMLNKPGETAKAFWLAGRQVERKLPENKQEAAAHYREAAQAYARCDMPEDEAACREALARLMETPVVKIYGQTSRELKVSEWNSMDIIIQNTGYGLAYGLAWDIKTDSFDVKRSDSIWKFEALAVGKQRIATIFIRPRAREIGDAVPFSLSWSWMDAEGAKYDDIIHTHVVVKGKHDSRPGSASVIVQPGANYYNAEKVVQGDEVQHKGDSVSINDGGVKLAFEPDHTQFDFGGQIEGLDCPNCGLPNTPGSTFCIHCHHAFKSDE